MKKTRRSVRKTQWLPHVDLTFERMKMNLYVDEVCVCARAWVYVCVCACTSVINVKLAFLFKCTFVC